MFTWEMYKFTKETSDGSRIPQIGGANSQGGGIFLLFGIFFPENYIKTKEIGLRGGRAPGAPSWIRQCGLKQMYCRKIDYLI